MPGNIEFEYGDQILGTHQYRDVCDNKHNFEPMIEEFRALAKDAISASNAYLEILTAKYVPDAVMARLRGEEVATDPPGILKKVTREKLEELVEPLPESPVKMLEIETTLAGEVLTIKADPSQRFFSWGGSTATQTQTYEGKVEDCLAVLENFEILKKTLRDIGSAISTFDKLIEAMPSTK